MPQEAAVRFVNALIDDLTGRARDDIGLLPFVARMIQARRDGFALQEHSQFTPMPGLFESAVEKVIADPDLKDAVIASGRRVNWNPVVAQSPDVDPALQAGMHAAHVFGPKGPLGCDKVRGGLFLLYPNIHYPLHTHLATELYYCLSGTLTLQHGVDGAPFDINPGEYSITPSERVHSLTIGPEPVLLIYCWVGEFEAPIYWWEKTDEVWGRTAWQRTPDGSWEPGPWSEVDADLLARQTLGPA